MEQWTKVENDSHFQKQKMTKTSHVPILVKFSAYLPYSLSECPHNETVKTSHWTYDRSNGTLKTFQIVLCVWFCCTFDWIHFPECIGFGPDGWTKLNVTMKVRKHGRRFSVTRLGGVILTICSFSLKLLVKVWFVDLVCGTSAQLWIKILLCRKKG